MVAKCLQKWDAPPSIGKRLNPFRNPRLVQELQSLLPLFRFSTRSDRCTIPQYDWTALQSLQEINWMTFPIYPWRLALPQISGRQEEYVVDQSTLNKESWKLQMLMLPGVSLGVATSYIRPVLSSFCWRCISTWLLHQKKKCLATSRHLTLQLNFKKDSENHEINLLGWENHPNSIPGNEQYIHRKGKIIFKHACW